MVRTGHRKCLNREVAPGFPDREFELRRIHRVGYFGDSVTYGVGAGYGYRISDVLRDAYPDREHLTFANLGISISEGRIAYVTSLAKAYSLDEAVYLLNLNTSHALSSR
jgi:hypothetical protein